MGQWNQTDDKRAHESVPGGSGVDDPTATVALWLILGFAEWETNWDHEGQILEEASLIVDTGPGIARRSAGVTEVGAASSCRIPHL